MKKIVSLFFNLVFSNIHFLSYAMIHTPIVIKKMISSIPIAVPIASIG
jgi:hypothetical protein